MVTASDSSGVLSEEPDAKKQRRSVEIVTVNVGGTRFMTSVLTLTTHSSYFASLLTGDVSIHISLIN